MFLVSVLPIMTLTKAGNITGVKRGMEKSVLNTCLMTKKNYRWIRIQTKIDDLIEIGQDNM